MNDVKTKHVVDVRGIARGPVASREALLIVQKRHGRSILVTEEQAQEVPCQRAMGDRDDKANETLIIDGVIAIGSGDAVEVIQQRNAEQRRQLRRRVAAGKELVIVAACRTKPFRKLEISILKFRAQYSLLLAKLRFQNYLKIMVRYSQ